MSRSRVAFSPTIATLRWKRGLPPGVYYERAQATRTPTVRLDVAAFIGLTERGPVYEAVPLTSWEEFMYRFGQPGGERLLPEAVHAFFANGGRRCVVVRCVDAGHATTAAWRLPGLLTEAGDPVYLLARDPGLWANEMAGRIEVQVEWRPLSPVPGSAVELDGLADLFRQARQGLLDDALDTDGGGLPWPDLLRRARDWGPEDAQDYLATWREVAGTDAPAEGTMVGASGPGLVSGATLRIVGADPGPGLPATEQVVRVEDARALVTGGIVARLASPLSAGLRSAAVLAGAQELRLLLGVRAGHVDEPFVGCGLYPDHPLFLPARLADPDEGSVLVRLGDLPPGMGLVFDPATFDLRGGQRVACFGTAAPPTEDGTGQVLVGRDGNGTTARAHFFEPPQQARPKDVDHPDWPAALPTELRCQLWNQLCIVEGFDGEESDDERYRSPLGALDRYDQVNEREPVSLVSMPDLLHPDSKTAPWVDEVDYSYCDEPLQFGPCTAAAVTAVPAALAWPLLGTDDREDLLASQRRLVDHCEAVASSGARRIAVLDLPPGLGSDRVSRWARRLASDRAALYAPYLRAPPAGQPTGALLTVPPGGAVCGIVARTEATRGVHAAPANEPVQALAALFADDVLPGAGFLFEARVNAIRVTERGIRVMGSRTTSGEAAWIHINVRRIVDFLARQLPLDARWAEFEPNDRVLWRRLELVVERRLEALFDAGALAGHTRENSWFVRTGALLTTQQDLDAGRVVVEVGVAPAVPAEFIIFRFVRMQDGQVVAEQARA